MNKNNQKCEICGKTVTKANNRPHSLHKTRKTIYPNLQKHNNKIVCARCLKKI